MGRCPPLGEGGAAIVADEEGASLIVALHGIKSALLVLGASAPMIVVTGGTDVNMDILVDAEKAQAMSRVLRAPNTVAVVSFSESMIDSMLALLQRVPGSGCTPPCHLIPQGVMLPKTSRVGCPKHDGHIEAAQALRHALRRGEAVEHAASRILLLVAGLRPVKDVLYLVWQKLHLVLVLSH